MSERTCSICGTSVEMYYQGKRGPECPRCYEARDRITSGAPKIVDFAVYQRRREVVAYRGR